MFGIVQGGVHEDLRRESAEAIGAAGVDGIAIGGTLGQDKERDARGARGRRCPHLPADAAGPPARDRRGRRPADGHRPRHRRLRLRGPDPARAPRRRAGARARRAASASTWPRAATRTTTSRSSRAARARPAAATAAPTSTTWRASKELTGARLLTLHNLTYMQRLTEARHAQAIDAGQLRGPPTRKAGLARRGPRGQSSAVALRRPRAPPRATATRCCPRSGRGARRPARGRCRSTTSSRLVAVAESLLVASTTNSRRRRRRAAGARSGPAGCGRRCGCRACAGGGGAGARAALAGAARRGGRRGLRCAACGGWPPVGSSPGRTRVAPVWSGDSPPRPRRRASASSPAAAKRCAGSESRATSTASPTACGTSSL